MVFTERRGEACCGIRHTSHDITGGSRSHVHGRLCRSLGVIDGDSELFKRLKVERQRVTEQGFAGRNDCFMAATELQILCRMGNNGKAIGCVGNVNRTNDDGLRGEFVAQFQANQLATDGDFHDLTHRTVAHVVIIRHETLDNRLLSRGPCAHPMIACHGP